MRAKNLRFWNLKPVDVECKDKSIQDVIKKRSLKIFTKYLRFGGYYTNSQCLIHFSETETLIIDITGS